MTAARRGTLRVYLGMAPGVGKTLALLKDAAAAARRGEDVVVGCADPHGRPEVETLLAGLASVTGAAGKELPLDEVLARRPGLVVVDELAHANPAGARHATRVSDVAEILDAGISVYTTLGVEQLESLRDVVVRVTGYVPEVTVSDGVLAGADSIALVDVPPDEFVRRILAEKAEGRGLGAPDPVVDYDEATLTALRELVLRRVADCVEGRLRRLGASRGADLLKASSPRILVCVAPNRLADRVVRAAMRLAEERHASLVAVSVEVARYRQLSETDKRLAADARALAERSGAEVVVRAGDDIVGEILVVAAEKSATQIVVGRPLRPRWRELLFGSVVDDLSRRAEGVDVLVLTGRADDGTKVRAVQGGVSWPGLAAAGGLILLVTYLAVSFETFFTQVNVLAVLLLVAVWVGGRYGRWEAVAATAAGFVAFAILFVRSSGPGSYGTAVYVPAFAAVVAVAVYVSVLTSRARFRLAVARDRERRTAVLYAVGRQFAVTSGADDAVKVACAELERLTGGNVRYFGPEALGADGPAYWAARNGAPAGRGTDTFGGDPDSYYPVMAGGDCHGVVVISWPEGAAGPSGGEEGIVPAVVDLLALVLARAGADRESRKVQVQMEKERIRSTLLSSVSHDLRTPLASVSGAASILADRPGLAPEVRQELAVTIVEESARLSRLIGNVLDMTRLSAGDVTIRREWNSVEEVIAAAADRVAGPLGRRTVTIEVPPDLPLVRIDPILVGQLLENLLENAARHTPPDASVAVAARSRPGIIELEVSDDGPGLPAGDEERVFERFVQVGSPATGAKGPDRGLGLGLAICRAVAAAHGGAMAALPGHGRAPGRPGVRFVATFPADEDAPPAAESVAGRNGA